MEDKTIISLIGLLVTLVVALFKKRNLFVDIQIEWANISKKTKRKFRAYFRLCRQKKMKQKARYHQIAVWLDWLKRLLTSNRPC